jgi:hypothetical protein
MEYIDGIPMALITGNDPNLQYVNTLGEGGYGRVYKVCSFAMTISDLF